MRVWVNSKSNVLAHTPPPLSFNPNLHDPMAARMADRLKTVLFTYFMDLHFGTSP